LVFLADCHPLIRGQNSPFSRAAPQRGPVKNFHRDPNGWGFWCFCQTSGALVIGLEVWSISEIGSQFANAWFAKGGNSTVQLDGALAFGGLLEVHCHLRAWPWLENRMRFPG
jgi:hypothetical protein